MGKTVVKQDDAKRSKVSQQDFPNVSFDEASRIAKGIWDNFAGKGAEPHQVALALELSPTSGGWRNLCGSSIAYGLTDGGYAAPQIQLTELGKRFVAPTTEDDDTFAVREAVLQPKILREFFLKYDKAKFPRDDIAENVLVQLGLPKDRSKASLAILKLNGKRAGFILETKTGPFVAATGNSGAVGTSTVINEIAPQVSRDELAEPVEEVSKVEPTSLPVKQLVPDSNRRVFITHGKNVKILEQIKKLVQLGGFEPVVSMQRETSAKPVPQKVMDDMRSCGAAVIHVGAEQHLVDGNGNQHQQINSNVLIEIGAAMALYGQKYILVVEKGVEMPSNLQGLYESRYEGEGLDMDSGMKILEALNGLNE
jgi:hypothetical protein